MCLKARTTRMTFFFSKYQMLFVLFLHFLTFTSFWFTFQLELFFIQVPIRWRIWEQNLWLNAFGLWGQSEYEPDFFYSLLSLIVIRRYNVKSNEPISYSRIRPIVNTKEKDYLFFMFFIVLKNCFLNQFFCRLWNT